MYTLLFIATLDHCANLEYQNFLWSNIYTQQKRDFSLLHLIT